MTNAAKIPTPTANVDASIKVLSGGSVNLVRAQAWSVGSIWTSSAEVLAAAAAGGAGARQQA